MRRVHALTNTFSGVAGEARVAAELVRCGLRVAKPYWTDDEIDLLILEEAQNLAVPIALQVKSVQFIAQTKSRVFLQGLKKRYVEKSPAFALAIYRVDTDEIFFVDGSQKVIDLYEAQKKWNKKHKSFKHLKDDADVRLALDKAKGLGDQWKVPRDDAAWLAKRVKDLADGVADQKTLVKALEALWQ